MSECKAITSLHVRMDTAEAHTWPRSYSVSNWLSVVLHDGGSPGILGLADFRCRHNKQKVRRFPHVRRIIHDPCDPDRMGKSVAGNIGLKIRPARISCGQMWCLRFGSCGSPIDKHVLTSPTVCTDTDHTWTNCADRAARTCTGRCDLSLQIIHTIREQSDFRHVWKVL